MVTQEELEKMSPEEIAELQRQNCIFCKIIKGDIPSQQVLSTPATQAILDIHPALAGHVLVLPKEHAPILPLLPPQSFASLFHDVKKVVKGVKEGMHAKRVSLFIANGPAAGQQASHFMLHVMPREDGDVLDTHFSLHFSSEFEKIQQEITPALKQNLPLMLKNHFSRLGKTLFPKPSTPASRTADSSVQKASDNARLQPDEDQQEKIAKFFEMYPQARNLLEQDFLQFEQLLEKVQPEVKELFAGIDLATLSAQLSKLHTSATQEPVLEESTSSTAMNFRAADIFKGENPEEQIKTIIRYFTEKPKAKELFTQDLDAFKSLLETREDIKPLFVDVDLDKLALVLDKLLEGVQSRD